MRKITKHKLRFWLPGWRLYKVWGAWNNEQYYILTNRKLPKYKYKSLLITDLAPKKLFGKLYLWTKN